MRGRIAPALVLAAGLSCACSPALNWREFQPAGSQARLMFPCRPASHARQVALAGTKGVPVITVSMIAIIRLMKA